MRALVASHAPGIGPAGHHVGRSLLVRARGRQDRRRHPALPAGDRLPEYTFSSSPATVSVARGATTTLTLAVTRAAASAARCICTHGCPSRATCALRHSSSSLTPSNGVYPTATLRVITPGAADAGRLGGADRRHHHEPRRSTCGPRRARPVTVGCSRDAPGWIRTSDFCLRRRSALSTELRAPGRR